MRAPVDTIEAPQFLPQLRWVNVKRLRVEKLRGRPVLIEFWDFCRPNSIRTLPYMKAWHERYGAPPEDPEATGLQVVGIHSPGFAPGKQRKAVIEAVARLGVEYPVMIDSELEMWREYENIGWPARYLFNADGMLFDYHFGEGAYEQTELAIQELLGLSSPPPLQPVRPEDAPDAVLSPQTEDQEGAYQGRYEAGAVWGVFDGAGTVQVNGGAVAGGRTLTIEHPGAYSLVEHERHTKGKLQLDLGEGVQCLATCFTPGLA
ncbi:MAG TPA: DipZ protein [Solirubrobacteraceae bacterium]